MIQIFLDTAVILLEDSDNNHICSRLDSLAVALNYIKYQNTQSSFKPDLRFKIIELNPVVQNLHTGVKQLQACQILCAGNTQMDLFWC